jgi:hypothetical protein
MKLYGGASVGIGITTGGVSYDNPEFVGQSNTTATFIWKFRPGVVFNDQIVAELPIGTVDGNFYFLPNVGVRF